MTYNSTVLFGIYLHETKLDVLGRKNHNKLPPLDCLVGMSMRHFLD